MAKRSAEEYLEALMGVADDLSFRDDESKEKWVNDHMKGAGYKPKLSWEDSPDDSGDSDKDSGVSSLFSTSREKRPTGKKGEKKDWMYG